MTEKDVLIEIKDWGLVVSIRKGFVLNNENFIPSIEFINTKLRYIGKSRVVIDWRLSEQKLSLISLVIGVEHLKSMITLLGKQKQAFVVNQSENTIYQKVVEDTNRDSSLQILYFFDMAKAIEWVNT